MLMCFRFFFFFSSRRRHTRCGRDWSSDVCSSDLLALPGGGALEARYQVEARRLDHGLRAERGNGARAPKVRVRRTRPGSGAQLVADEGELQEEDPEVVLGGGGVEVAALAAARAGVDRLGAQGQGELDVGLHLAGVQGALEPAVLDRPPEPDVVEVDPAVAGRVVVVRAVVVVAVPGPVHLLEIGRASCRERV